MGQICFDTNDNSGFSPPFSARLTIAIAVAALLVTALGMSFKLVEQRRLIMSGAKDEVRFGASLVAAHLDGAMTGVEQMLHGVGAYAELSGVIRHGDVQLRNYLLLLKAMNPIIQDILVLGADGSTANWTGYGRAPSFRDHEFAKVHLGGFVSGMHVGDPFISPVQPGRWACPTSIATRDGVGNVELILVALLDLGHFHEQFATVEMPDGASFAAATASGAILSGAPHPRLHRGKRFPLLASFWDRGKKSGDQTAVSPVEGTLHVIGFERAGRYRLIGMASRDRDKLLANWRIEAYTLGVIWLALAAFTLVVTFISVQGQLRTARLAAIDPLTKLPNRRAFMRAATDELRRARRHGRDTAALLMDVDHFKKVNDTYGHDVGDLALKAVSRILAGACRSTDLPCRYGGEEFAMILPETGLEGALAVAEKIRSLVEEATIDAGRTKLRITCSVGVTARQDGDDPLEALLKRADEALYEAKASGRNLVRNK